MNKNLLGSSAVSIILLMMSASVINAQDAATPWHLTAKENGKEVAFYNVEHIIDVKATAQTVTIVLDNGKQFSHPIATIFGFDPRKSGTATANEMITVPQWKVSYANGRLNFSEAVTGVAVYSIMGVLMSRSAGTYTNVPVNLPPGVYVVQAGDKTAKLMITGGGFGGNDATVAQPVQSAVVPQAVANAPSPVSLRAGTVKIYWNITTSNTAFPVEIPEVEKFYFTPDNSIVFTLKNGTTIQLDDYKNVTFTAEPTVTTNSNIDWNSTLLYCGAGYDQDGNVYYSIATKTEFWIYDAKNNKTTKIAKSSIRQNVIDNPSKLPNGSTIEGSGHVGVFTSNGNTVVCMGMVYRRKAIYNDGSSEYGYVNYDFINDKSIFYPERIFSFNNNQWIIPATISADANGTITVSTSVGKHTF